MKFKETKIATYTNEKTKIQLLKITNTFIDLESDYTDTINKYQIRVNRKIVYTTGFEYDARKNFAAIIQIDILQLKIY